MFGTADVAVDWHPKLELCEVPCRVEIVGIAEAQEVPRRARKTAHRVCLPMPQPPVEVGRIDKFGNAGQRRRAIVAWLVVVHIGQFNWEAVLRNKLQFFVSAVDDWNRATPIA